MRSDDPLRKRPEKPRPAIWASGGQRPPFDLRALGRGALFLAREIVVPLHNWAAHKARTAAINVKHGAGRIPAAKLGRAERFVPSHLRVAGWIKNLGTVFAHASATADLDIERGNALVARIAPHLWDEALPVSEPTPAQAPPSPEMPARDEAAPVVLTEPQVEADPLASIRDEFSGRPVTPGGKPVAARPAQADQPPAPPGPVAEGAIQVVGYLIGWASVGLALPYGIARALWLWFSGRDLKAIGRED
jgi:hypothetical protein